MNFFDSLNGLNIPMLKINDIFEIVIIAFILYSGLKNIVNTRVMIILKGLGILFVLYCIAYICSFSVIVTIFNSIFALLIVAIIFIFQPELRKVLEQLGTKSLTGGLRLSNLFKHESKKQAILTDKEIDALLKACFKMGESKTGALIVLQGHVPLTEYINTGITLNSDLSTALLLNIFEKNTPLHDGALIMEGNKLKAATCYLPLSENTKLSKSMGTRHRAAVGLTEVTDGLVIVVSEETGAISYSLNGNVYRHQTKEDMREVLSNYCSVDKSNIIGNGVDKIKQNSLFTIFKHNGMLKLSSLALSIVIWFLLITLADPVSTIELKQIPVDVINENIILSMDKQYKVVSGEYVDVYVSGRRSLLSDLDADDIVITADMTKLSYVNAISLDWTISDKSELTLTFKSDSMLRLEIEDIVHMEFPFEVNLESDLPKTQYAQLSILEESGVYITGAKSVVSTITKVVVDAELKDGVVTIVAEPALYNKGGEIVNATSLEVDTTGVKIEVNTLDVITVPLTINTDRLIMDNYKIIGIEYTPKELQLAGTPEALEGIVAIVKTLDVNLINAIDANEFVKVYKLADVIPQGVICLNAEENITVTVSFEPMEVRDVGIQSSDIVLLNKSPDYTYTFDSDIYVVSLKGTQDALAQVSSASVSTSLDVAGYGEGTFNLIVQVDAGEYTKVSENIIAKLTVTKVKT